MKFSSPFFSFFGLFFSTEYYYFRAKGVEHNNNEWMENLFFICSIPQPIFRSTKEDSFIFKKINVEKRIKREMKLFWDV
jgi:hypothetical protein